MAALQDQVATLTTALKACQASSPVTRTSATAIDRSKFDAVYRAGKAVDGASSPSAHTSLAAFRGLLLTFETEAGVAVDKAAGPEEVALAKLYREAKTWFDIGLISQADDPRRLANWTKASETLAQADKVYLGK